MSLVFFDTETTGLNVTFDQILQFAAVRTDDELNETDVLDIRCRLLPYVVPSPEALLINGTTAQRLCDTRLQTHYQMVRGIYEKLGEWSPTLFIGYNSLSFDESLLRQAFYQTLHPPYLTNTNGNCRADALRLLRFTATFAPGCLAVPSKPDGSRSFRLEDIAAANGFSHSGGAHDALNDTRATIHLCKLISARAPELWSSFTRFSQKRAVVDYMQSEVIFGLCTFRGHEPETYMLTTLGPAPSYGAEYLAFDLANDPSRFARMADEDLVAALSQLPYPVRRVRTNACPALLDAEIALSASTTAHFIELQELERRASIVQQDTTLKARLIALSEKTRKTYPHSIHVEQQIFDAFIGDADLALLRSFHAANWEDREAILNQLNDRRLKQLGRRLIFTERPDVFQDALRKAMSRALAERVVKGDAAASWLCLDRALAQVELLLASASELNRALLLGHRETWQRQLTSFLAELAS